MPSFPFSAVTGQSQYKLALILVAINPAIGGVLVSGPRGCAKSTLARGFADLRAPNHPFVTLPLGATEEMLVGTLDLQQVLDNKNVAFSPGLLAKADTGTLYVDEVNLLPDSLVDLLLDVAASGVNCVERDGISHEHSAKFTLLGTMNPDEGELRPQLLDRFGLSVNLDNHYSIDERMEIVQSREAFDTDASAFTAKYQSEQSELAHRISQAQAKLASVACSDDYRRAIAIACDTANVDGLRADIVWYRAALAHAAFNGRDAVTQDDIDAVAELVLNHRRRSPSDNPPPKGSNQSSSDQQSKDQAPNRPSQSPFKRPEDSKRSETSSNADHKDTSSSGSDDTGSDRDSSNQDDSTNQGDSSNQGDWGSMKPQVQKTQNVVVDLDHFKQALAPVMNTQEVSANLSESSRKKGLSNHKQAIASSGSKGKVSGKKPDWFQTLIANPNDWPPKSLRFKPEKTGQQVLHLVLLDTSASTLQANQFAKAKGVILALADQAYLDREQMSILGFGNEQVSTLLAQVRAPKDIRAQLDQIEAGGGTPLRQVIEQAQSQILRLKRNHAALTIKAYLITDGKTTQNVNGLHLDADVAVVDVESGPIKRGRAQVIAHILGGHYLPLSA